MTKARVLVVEVEGEQAVLDAIRSFAGAVGVPTPPSPPERVAAPGAELAALPAAPVAVEAAIEAPAPRRGGAGKARTPRPSLSAPAAAEEPPTSMAGAVRAALGRGALSNGDVLRMLTDAGFETDSKRVTQMLCTMRGKGEVYKGDEDYLWRLAEAGGRAR